MITVGVDMASQTTRTALCVVEWSEGAAAVVRLTLGATDADILALVAGATKAGFDVPLGWPAAFADAVSCHSTSGSWPRTYRHADNRAYRYRRTDLAVWQALGGSPPLSVSTDRIALPAMRAAALLSLLPAPAALDGSGVVVEVYPAAALRRWGMTWRGYKRSENAGTRGRLVGSFLAEAAWLRSSEAERALCLSSDDAFDALVSAFVARAAAVGLVEEVPDGERAAALREGWIALPLVGSLARLALGAST